MADPPWEPPLAGTEAEHLLGALDRLRMTFQWKTDGLDAADARHGSGTQHPDELANLEEHTSVHLSVLRNAGLVSSTKEGRSVTYRAERGAVERLATFLSEAAK